MKKVAIILWIVLLHPLAVHGQDADCVVSEIFALASMDLPAKAEEEGRIAGRITAQSARCVEYGLTPLHAAVAVNAEELTKVLLAKNAPTNVTGPVGITPLMISAQNNSTRIARLLLARGAELSARDTWGRSAMQLAVIYDAPEVLDVFVKKNSKEALALYGDRTLMHLAAINDSGRVANLLVLRQVSMDPKDASGLTALDYARLRGFDAFAAQLKNHGAKSALSEAELADRRASREALADVSKYSTDTLPAITANTATITDAAFAYAALIKALYPTASTSKVAYNRLFDVQLRGTNAGLLAPVLDLVDKAPLLRAPALALAGVQIIGELNPALASHIQSSYGLSIPQTPAELRGNLRGISLRIGDRISSELGNASMAEQGRVVGRMHAISGGLDIESNDLTDFPAAQQMGEGLVPDMSPAATRLFQDIQLKMAAVGYGAADATYFSKRRQIAIDEHNAELRSATVRAGNKAGLVGSLMIGGAALGQPEIVGIGFGLGLEANFTLASERHNSEIKLQAELQRIDAEEEREKANDSSTSANPTQPRESKDGNKKDDKKKKAADPKVGTCVGKQCSDSGYVAPDCESDCPRGPLFRQSYEQFVRTSYFPAGLSADGSAASFVQRIQKLRSDPQMKVNANSQKLMEAVRKLDSAAIGY